MDMKDFPALHLLAVLHFTITVGSPTIITHNSHPKMSVKWPFYLVHIILCE
jgi:hypothetical protein